MKTKQHKLIPQLRFPEFNAFWESKPFKELTKINQGLQIPISERYLEQVEGSYFYITNEFLKKGSKNTYFIKNPSNSVLCNEDDILMTRTGNTGMVVTNVSGAFHNNFFKIAYPDYINKTFLYYFLTLDVTQNFIKRLAGTSTIPDLNHSDFYKIKFNFPSLSEQQKIASFLTDVDDKITKLTKKKTLLEQYKKGVMQKIFNQELRFKDDNGNEFPKWEEKKLGTLVKKAQSGGTPKSTNKSYYDGNIPFLSISDMTTQGKYLKYTSKSISQLGIDNSSSWIVPINSLIYSMYASVGFVSINKIDLATSQAVMNIILKDNINIEYIYYYLVDFKQHIHRMIETGTQGNINASIVKGIKIDLPCQKEQTKIANFLSDIDTKIEALHTKIENSKNFKKGLLQQLFV